MLYWNSVPGCLDSGKVAPFTLELLLKAQDHCVTENDHRLSGLKVTLPIVTHGVLIRDVSAKKLIKQEALINHQVAPLRVDLAAVLLGPCRAKLRYSRGRISRKPTLKFALPGSYYGHERTLSGNKKPRSVAGSNMQIV